MRKRIERLVESTEDHLTASAVGLQILLTSFLSPTLANINSRDSETEYEDNFRLPTQYLHSFEIITDKWPSAGDKLKKKKKTSDFGLRQQQRSMIVK